MRCPACTSEIAVAGESCPSCGASLEDSYAETRILPEDSKSRSGSSSGPGRKTGGRTRTNSVHTTTDALDNSRFVFGTIYPVPFNRQDVTPQDPPRTVSGMANLSLDTRARAARLLPAAGGFVAGSASCCSGCSSRASSSGATTSRSTYP